MKKWIALCLSLVMVLSCCGMAASAEERYLGVMLRHEFGNRRRVV